MIQLGLFQPVRVIKEKFRNQAKYVNRVSKKSRVQVFSFTGFIAHLLIARGQWSELQAKRNLSCYRLRVDLSVLFFPPKHVAYMLLSLHVNIKKFLLVRKHIVNMENKEIDNSLLVNVFKEKRDKRHKFVYHWH